MSAFLNALVKKPVLTVMVVLAAAVLGWYRFSALSVDVFPDIAVPRVVVQTEAAGLTAEEVEQRVTIPVESAMNGIPGVSVIRSSSSGGLSFVWVEFDWNVDLTRARFEVSERLQRVRESLPVEADAEIAPTVSVTGEIMLVALTSAENGATPLEMREFAEYELRPRLLAERGIGEVVVLGGRLPEYRISAAPRRLAEYGLSLPELIDAVRDTRTYAGAGYLASVGGEELPLRQIARADTLESIRRSPVIVEGSGALRLEDVAEVSLAGAPRRGSASYEGREAVIVSVQKTPGGNTPEITKRLDRAIEAVRPYARLNGIELDAHAYRQADFIDASVSGGATIVRDAAAVVLVVLTLTLFRLRTILVVLASMALTIPVSIAFFPVLGLGINVMTLGGFAVAAGDIVDAAIIFSEVVWRRRNVSIVEAMKSVLPGVAFSTFMVVLVFVPLLLLTGLEGAFFRPLALSYLVVFVVSLVVALALVPALSKVLGRDRKRTAVVVNETSGESLGVRFMKMVYRPFLFAALRFPKTALLLVTVAGVAVIRMASGFGSSFLPPFHEDSFNVVLSLPPGASLDESERVAEACVGRLRAIAGVKSVVRRTGRAERDQHAEPVSSSEYVVRIDMDGDVERVRRTIRERLNGIPGCSVLVGYPISHRISAVLSGTEAELAVNVYGEDIVQLRRVAAQMKARLDAMNEVSDVRANREITLRTLKIDYNIEALAEAGMTLREAGEQVSAAFNGVEVGEVRQGLKRRAVTVRLEGFDGELAPKDVSAFMLVSRSGKRVRLDEVARVVPEDASDLLLRESGRRKALISLNAAEGVDAGRLIEKLRRELDPIAETEGVSVEYGGSCQARESAVRRLAVLSVVLTVAVFLLLMLALKSVVAALLALINVPLALIGAVIAVWCSNPVLSVSSLVGFVTVVGFVLRNGILMLQRYRELADSGMDAESAIRSGSLERMVPILMTSLTTVLGLIPIVLAGDRPGGELLSPFAVVQFGGILGASALNLVVLPAAALLAFRRMDWKCAVRPVLAVSVSAAVLAGNGCRTYTPAPVDWERESSVWMKSGSLDFSSLDDVAAVAVVGNSTLNRMRIERAASVEIAKAAGWWEDPEFDVDLLRIVNPADKPYLGGASLAFTIPLSGVPRLERKAAEAYSEAAAAEIVAAEREISSKARMAAIRMLAMRRMAEELRGFEQEERIRQAFVRARRLVAAGELSTTDLSAAERRRHERIHKLRKAENDADAAESELRGFIGVSPEVKLNFADTLARECPHTSLPPDRSALEYTRHPRVVAAMKRLDGGEAALEAEIRRQYPDLKLGPAYSREEGLDRFGLVAGIELPLWNRNRKGIAEAEGARNSARADAVSVWRELVEGAASARRNLARLLEHRAESALKNAAEANELADAGELDALAFISVREEILDAELNEQEWKAGVCLAFEELEKYKVEERQ